MLWAGHQGEPGVRRRSASGGEKTRGIQRQGFTPHSRLLDLRPGVVGRQGGGELKHVQVPANYIDTV